MQRWLFGLIVVLTTVRQSFAVTCDGTSVTEGLVCVMSDNVTQGACTGGACIRTYTIPGNGPRTGTGTISSSGATVTGSGTAFTTELKVGDELTAGGQTASISSISSGTSLTLAIPFVPAISAGSAFTYTNPIVRWLNASGNTVAVLTASGQLAIGQVYTVGALSIVGQNATAAGANALSPVSVTAGNGANGPLSNGGLGADINFTAGGGGNSAQAAAHGGAGGFLTYTAGAGGPGSAGADGGNGGNAFWNAGGGGATDTSARFGGTGGTNYVLGGAGGSAVAGATKGDGGSVVISGGVAGSGAGTGGVVGDSIIGLNGGITKIGTSAQIQVNNATGDITKIKNVPVAGMWNVNAFQQANAGGM